VGSKYGGGQAMKCVVCVLLKEHRDGPMNFGTFNAKCRKNIEIKDSHEYLFVDIGLSGNEMDCKKELYGEYKNVRFITILPDFYKTIKMDTLDERIESSIYLVWHEYLKNPKMQYKNSPHEHFIWIGDNNGDKIDKLEKSLEINNDKILHRSERHGFSQYGAFKISSYEDIMMEELFNTDDKRLAFV
jgi:hypothetical protein